MTAVFGRVDRDYELLASSPISRATTTLVSATLLANTRSLAGRGVP